MAVLSTVSTWVKSAWKKSVVHRAMLVAPPVVAILLLGFWKVGARGPVTYYTATVEHGDISQVVQSTGTINAVTTVQVGSQVSGTISSMSVDFNSRVKKGQVIAQIDPAILKTRLLQAEADLANAQANVKSMESQIDTQKADLQAQKANVDRARAQLTQAELSWNRNKELLEQGIVAKSVLDTEQANYESAVANVKVAEAQSVQSQTRVRSAQANLEQAKAQVQQRKAAAESARVDLNHTTIYAPIDGTVIARNVDVGQTVAASLQAPTLFIIAQDLTKMLVYAKTDEADVGKIKVGATANFRVDSYPRETFSGKVNQVRMNATMVQNVVTYDTIVEFDNPDQRLFPGTRSAWPAQAGPAVLRKPADSAAAPEARQWGAAGVPLATQPQAAVSSAEAEWEATWAGAQLARGASARRSFGSVCPTKNCSRLWCAWA
ncbi:MAG: efflux RND transporter periplasmic adaptor subunit [Acidobacteria bacterium]|nr:efflux RND transporter periplasmic adaptor subunit [Acidobacteriota bacterium]